MPPSLPVPRVADDVQADLVYAGRILRQTREQQRVGVVALATRVGISKSQLAEIETAQRKVSYDTMLRLVRALGISMHDLVRPEGPSVLAQITLELHARGTGFMDAQLALLKEIPPSLPRRRTA